MKRKATIGAALSLVISGALLIRLIAIDNEIAFLILIPAAAGAGLALWRPTGAVLVVATILTSLTAMVSLFGGLGLLYLPTIVLFVMDASGAEQPPARALEGTRQQPDHDAAEKP